MSAYYRFVLETTMTGTLPHECLVRITNTVSGKQIEFRTPTSPRYVREAMDFLFQKRRRSGVFVVPCYTLNLHEYEYAARRRTFFPAAPVQLHKAILKAFAVAEFPKNR